MEDGLNFNVKQEWSRQPMPRRENRGAASCAKEFEIVPVKICSTPRGEDKILDPRRQNERFYTQPAEGDNRLGGRKKDENHPGVIINPTRPLCMLATCFFLLCRSEDQAHGEKSF